MQGVQNIQTRDSEEHNGAPGSYKSMKTECIRYPRICLPGVVMRGHPRWQEIQKPQKVLGVPEERQRLRIDVVFHIYVAGHIGILIRFVFLGRNFFLSEREF